jgi:rubrerythrin
MSFVDSVRTVSLPMLLAAALSFSATLFGVADPAVAKQELNPATRTALIDALADERKAEAFYQAVIDHFGAVMPFSKIVEAERRHAGELEQLCQKYGVEFSEHSTDEKPSVPDSLKAACQASIDAENRNIALYDELIPKLEGQDVRQTFERLQAASRDRHLPAFTRCVENDGAYQHGRAGDSAAGGCGGEKCGMGGACGCGRASESEKKARAAGGGGCGCGKGGQQGK